MRRASPRVRGRRPMIVPLVTGHTRRHASYHESAEALLNGSALSADVDSESGRRSPRPWSSTRTTWRSARRGRPGPVARVWVPVVLVPVLGVDGATGRRVAFGDTGPTQALTLPPFRLE